MEKTRNSLKTRLVAAILALVMLVGTLAGTTFAWFTDGVTSAGNKIQTGSLRADLWHKVDADWVSLKENPEHKVFDYDNWEPGYTRIEQLKITNDGSLALKYNLAVEVAKDTAILGDNGENLANVIDVYVLYGESNVTDFASITANGSKWVHKGTLAEAMSKPSEFMGGELTAGSAAPLAIALHMQESAGNEYQELSVGDIYVNLIATQWSYENDSIGKDYDKDATFPEMKEADIEVQVPVSNGAVSEAVTVIEDGYTITVPAGVKVTGSKLGLTVTEKAETESNVVLNDGQEIRPLDVHVEGVAADNTTPIVINLGAVMTKGLNMGNYTLYHVENGEDVAMVLVGSVAELDAHNEFYYDPATGEVTVAMQSFSEVAVVASEATWEGEYDYSWYDASKTELLIANADQLAGFGAIVGGMNGRTADDFAGKTVKLVADIKINDLTDEDGRAVMFYPIGYYNTTGSYVKQAAVEVTSGFNNFAGTFDGNGHTVSDWYQNTWEAFGDYNDGYSGTPNHYRDGFGLFGRVYKGTVKNLTVKNFSSDGEFTTTGTIAAYAEGATFENIAIFNCNPRVYNIGNGGIVGCVGWYAKEAGLKTTFKNITVDNTNKISALWGSWDVACGGIVGQYYPTSGQTSANKPSNGGVHFENCHVAAQIDVYNDVCANYQYYAYRYAGILMGSVRENVTSNGHEYPDMTGITASGCTVHFGDWNDYYYCELVANSLASYTHDHQMSRLTQVEKLDANAKKYLPLGKADVAENWVAIPESGRQNYVVVNGKTAEGKWDHGDGKATCYHFVNGVQHKHDVADADNPNVYETVDGVEVLKEDKQCVYREFNNLVTGYGWGVTSKGVDDMDGVTILDREEAGSVPKFTVKGVTEIESYTAIKLSDLFNFVNNGVELKLEGLNVTVTDLNEQDGMATGTFTKGKTWEDSTITINGKGAISITIQDYYFCAPITITLTAIDPMTSLTVDATMLYQVGQELNINSITVNYKSGAKKVLSADEYILSDYDMSFGGKKTIAVQYTELGHSIVSTFTVTVSDTFNTITVTPDKDIYNVGDTVKFTVYAVAADGTRAEVNGADVSGADTSVAGIKTVTITFGNKSTTCQITVVNNTSLDGITDQQDEHALFWYYNHQFMLGGIASSSTNNYNDYIGKNYTGTNGEIATGFNNDFAGVYAHAGSPNGGNALIRGDAQYGLNITDALPYTYVGIRCIAGFDAKLLGFGYYVDGDTSTLTYDAPVYYSDKVLTDPSYQQFVNLGGQYTAEANTTVCLSDLGFTAGSNHTITWVAVFEDGYQTLANWTIKMKSSFGTNEFFKDTEKPNVNVIVLSGQSNAAGVSPITFDYQVKYNSVNYKNIFMQYKNVGFNDGTKYTMSENAAFETYYYGMGGAYADFFGPDAALAYYLATTPGLMDEQWFIIKYTAPGTGLELHWLNNTNLADEMMTYVENCIGDLTDQYDVQIHSLLWMQGENDALVEDIAGRYAANEQAFVTMFRNKFAKYATLPNNQIPGSGISFISAGIAPAGKDGNGWTYATAVNNAKRDNAYIWYAPGSIGVQSALYDYINYFADNGAGGKSGSIINPNSTYGIYNSVYIDTSLMSAKADDAAHYDAQSMEWLGTWFAQFVEHMMTVELPAPPASSGPVGNVIIFNANGGTCDTPSMTVMPDEAVTLPVPTHEHFSFLCWFDGTNMYWPGDEPTFTGNVTLTALWAATITCPTGSTNGITASVDKTAAIAGLEAVTITFTNTQNQQRTIYVTVTDSTGATLIAKKAITVPANGSVTETFTPQNGNVTIEVTPETYTITCPTAATNSITATVDKNTAASDETITITFKNTSSNWGNKTVYVTVTDENGNELLPRTEIRLSRNATDTRTFTVQNDNVTITISRN